MQQLLLHSTLALAIVVAAPIADPALAQSSSDLKARCDQLISLYDRYGSARVENSDGVRNHTRIGAGIECERGHYAEGIASMEGLLRRKHFDVPPPTGLAETPSSSTGGKPQQ